MPHDHHIFLWAVFLTFAVGHWLWIYLSAGASKASTLSGINSFKAYIEANSRSIAIRFCFESAFVLYWMANPGFVNGLLQYMAKRALPNDFPAAFVNFPLGVPEAFFFGLGVDALLDKGSFVVEKLLGLTWLTKEVPPSPSRDDKKE